MRMAKWGNSLAVRLPASLVEEPGLVEGVDVKIRGAGKRMLEIVPDRARQKALERLRSLRVDFPKDYKFDRDEANGRRCFPR